MMLRVLGVSGDVIEIVLLFEARRPRGTANWFSLADRV